jgi:uncharacterized protein
MRRAFVLVFLLGLVACGNGFGATDAPEAAPPDPTLEPSPPFNVSEVTLIGPGADDEVTVPVFVAASRPDRQLGLQHREELPAGTGMVFLFPEDSTSGFWMKDTLIPLSIAFADADGRIVRIIDMEPCEADPCPVYDPEATYRMALEVNQGFFDTVGADEGWRIDLPAELRPPAGLL